MLIEAELTRHKSCGTLMAEFRMRWKPSMRQPGEGEMCRRLVQMGWKQSQK